MIRIIKLSDSGYSDIDKLERDLIEKYDSYKSGYNKTGGNSWFECQAQPTQLEALTKQNSLGSVRCQEVLFINKYLDLLE